jgi:tetratricopeptide (TPR) repeat protein
MPYLGSATLADVLDRVRRSAVAPDAARIILEAASGAGADEIARAEEPPADVLRMGSYVEGILHLALQLADALAFIHERGILHRDLKPSNVLLSPSGRPMLLDFNLAADSQRMGARFGGTLPYMAPEQLRALDPQATEQRDAVDARADLFALGVIVYELLAREHPFGPWPAALSSAELGRLLRDRQRHPPRRLSLAHRGVDVRLALLVERCLAFDPAQRPQSALELAAQLRQLLAQRRKRWRARAALTLATAAVLLLAGVVFLPRYPTRPAAPDWLTRGQEYCQHGEYERGVECFNRVLERDPDLEAAWFHRGRAYQKLGEFILALESYRRAYQLAPQGRLSALMGYCDSQVQQHYAAISHYERAIAEGFATAEVYNNRGCSSLQVSLHDKAQESLDAALQLDPQLQAACYNRALLDYARALKTAGHVPRRGIEDIETAIRVGPVTAAHHRDAARLHAVAARQDPNQKPFALRHARIAVDLGQDPSALAADRALLSLFCEPEFKELVRQSRKNPPPIKPLRFLDPVPEP